MTSWLCCCLLTVSSYDAELIRLSMKILLILKKISPLVCMSHYHTLNVLSTHCNHLVISKDTGDDYIIFYNRLLILSILWICEILFC